MIKIPKEVKNLIKTLEDAGFKAYAAGECVRDSLAGLKPYDWDLATSAVFEDLKNLFPDAEIVSEKYSVIRKEFVEETYDSDGVFSGEEGLIVDIGTFRKDNIFAGGVKAEAAEFADTIEEDLSRRAFTAEAGALFLRRAGLFPAGYAGARGFFRRDGTLPGCAGLRHSGGERGGWGAGAHGDHLAAAL